MRARKRQQVEKRCRIKLIWHCHCGAQMADYSQTQKEPHNIHQAHVEKVCEICGDVGFQEAIITCCECKNVVVHQYCVLGYYEDEPMDWCCEECHIGKSILFSSSGLDNEHSEGSRLKASAKIFQSGCTILEHRSPGAVNESRKMNSSRAHPCDPALVPSWKGSFDILRAPELALGIFNNCIQAHLPSRVRRNVYEFSQLLPDTLKLELVPRGDIWASLFDNHCPAKEDIGLYFFARESERSEIYIALVEFMRTKDLLMRMVINDVELLILASTTLSNDSQRWNGEHFLWGLFYRRGPDTVGCAEGHINSATN